MFTSIFAILRTPNAYIALTLIVLDIQLFMDLVRRLKSIGKRGVRFHEKTRPAVNRQRKLARSAYYS